MASKAATTKVAKKLKQSLDWLDEIVDSQEDSDHGSFGLRWIPLFLRIPIDLSV